VFTRIPFGDGGDGRRRRGGGEAKIFPPTWGRDWESLLLDEIPPRLGLFLFANF
jgi:hypothetical protein